MDRIELIETLRYCKAKSEERKDAFARCETARKSLEELNRRPQLQSVSGKRFSAPAAWLGFVCAALLGVVYLFLPRMREWMAAGKLRTVVAVCAALVFAAIVSQAAGLLVGGIQRRRMEWKVEEENEETIRLWERRKVKEGFPLRQDLQRFEELCQSAEREMNERAELCGLHPRYRGERSLKYLIEYLESGRADSLKEALNLYEADIERYRQRKERREFREHIEKLLREELSLLQRELKRDLDEVSANLAATAAEGLGAEDEEPLWED